jgi:protein required for attachment to host cells
MLHDTPMYNAYIYLLHPDGAYTIMSMGSRRPGEPFVVSDLLINKKTTWIVVADESAATVYDRKSRNGPLKELFQLANEASRKKTADLISDRGGRSFDSHGQGRHTMTKEQSGPKKQAAHAFAKIIAGRINNAIHDGACDEIALIAAPRFLGVLRDALEKAGNVMPALTIDKEMVGRDIADIEKLLDKRQ